MKRLCLALVVCPIACAAPEGMMADTDDTETSSGSSGSEGTMTTVGTSVTAGTSMTTTTATTTMGNTTATTSTTMDPDTTDGSMTATDATTTGECPPGDLGCPCDIGSTCSGELMCIDGTCVDELPCDEPEGEPNDDEASAVELEEAVCMDMAMAIDAGLSGAESDWFTFHGSQGAFCQGFGIDPQVSVQADSDLAICIFVVCDEGDATLGCSGGSQDSDSPDGAPGCCDQNSVGLNNLNCGGLNPENATLWVRLTSTEEICIPYTLSWEY